MKSNPTNTHTQIPRILCSHRPQRAIPRPRPWTCFRWRSLSSFSYFGAWFRWLVPKNNKPIDTAGCSTSIFEHLILIKTSWCITKSHLGFPDVEKPCRKGKEASMPCKTWKKRAMFVDIWVVVFIFSVGICISHGTCVSTYIHHAVCIEWSQRWIFPMATHLYSRMRQVRDALYHGIAN